MKADIKAVELPEGIVIALSRLVRSMNCYYSNLIEGHDTHPIDIERALNEDFSHDPAQRDLQLEARAHIEVQQWIDQHSFSEKATSTNSILEMHKRFCSALPDNLLWVENPNSGEKLRIVPGTLRQRDVKIGRLVAISPGALPRFMTRLKPPMQIWAMSMPSLHLLRRITVCFGCILFWMAMDGLRD